MSVEIAAGDEVIGTVHRDVEDGEVSYAVHLTILAEDLPSVARAGTVPVPAAPKRRR